MKQLGIIILVIIVLSLTSTIFGRELYLEKQPTITIGSSKFFIEVAKSPAEKDKGLGMRKSLPINWGMYFPFEKEDFYAFWMKDMEFPIDIIYISDRKVVTIFYSIKPAKDPSTTVVRPTQPIDSVLEINAGLAQKDNIKIGDSVIINFKL